MAVTLQVHRDGTLVARLELGPRHLARVRRNWRRQVSIREGPVGIGGGPAAEVGSVMFRGRGYGDNRLSIGGGGRRGRTPGAAQAGRYGRRDEELEEAAGRCPPPRVLGTATLQVRRAVGGKLAGAPGRERRRGRPAGGQDLRLGGWRHTP